MWLQHRQRGGTSKNHRQRERAYKVCNRIYEGWLKSGVPMRFSGRCAADLSLTWPELQRVLTLLLLSSEEENASAKAVKRQLRLIFILFLPIGAMFLFLFTSWVFQALEISGARAWLPNAIRMCETVELLTRWHHGISDSRKLLP